jgi:uncharacterized membrane protein
VTRTGAHADMLRWMALRLPVLFETLRERLWLIPAIAAVVAAILAWALVRLDHTVGSSAADSPFFSGGPESARLILSTIAAAMLTFTGLVFTVTMLVLQLASSQFSPRVTRTFLRDRNNQLVLGIFVATFVYALLVLRDVRSVGDTAFVPSIAVSWAFVLLLTSVGAFVFYIDHMAHAMRVSTIIASVAAETRGAIDRCYPAGAVEAPRAIGSLPDVNATIRAPHRPGVLQGVDIHHLIRIASDHGSVLELSVAIGDPIPGDAPLVRIRGGDEVEPEGVLDAIAIGRERAMGQDPGYGFRQLIDVAVRALSPGINDPTTATQVIDQLHDLMRRLASRSIPGPERFDDSGTLRVILPGPDWAAYLDLACREIGQYGAGSDQVERGISRMLDDLETLVDGDRLAAVRRQRTPAQ